MKIFRDVSKEEKPWLIVLGVILIVSICCITIVPIVSTFGLDNKYQTEKEKKRRMYTRIDRCDDVLPWALGEVGDESLRSKRIDHTEVFRDVKECFLCGKVEDFVIKIKYHYIKKGIGTYNTSTTSSDNYRNWTIFMNQNCHVACKEKFQREFREMK